MGERFLDKYRIPSARLSHYDYSSNGCYFVTICTQNREKHFGNIMDGEMQLSKTGYAAHKYWLEIPNHFPCVTLDVFVVMPNHVHGIIQIDRHCRDAINRVSTENRISEKGGITKQHNPMLNPFSLAKIIRWYKGRVTFETNNFSGRDAINRVSTMEHVFTVWQSRFYDRIIRHENELLCTREYIIGNPENWARDRNNQSGSW